MANLQQINVTYRNFYNRSLIEYECRLAADLKQNSKLFHEYIRSKKIGNPSVGPLMTETGLLSDCGEMAVVFADAFSSV